MTATSRVVPARRKGASHRFLSAGAAPLVVAFALQMMPMRRSVAEDRIDFKTLYYKEDGGRMEIWEPTFQFEKALSPTLTIRLNGVYNAISGASPTGAPPSASTRTTTVAVPAASTSYSTSLSAPAALTPSSISTTTIRGDDDEEEGGADRRALSLSPQKQVRTYLLRAGATPTATAAPAPTVAPAATTPAAATASTASRPATRTQTVTVPERNGKVPKADVEDTRVAFDVELIKKIGIHAPALQLAYSVEDDYESRGIALKDAIDLNKKNTTLLFGAAYTDDEVDGPALASPESKRTVDLMAGFTQVLSRRSLLTLNLTYGRGEGFLSDPYKVAEVNGQLLPDTRPDERERRILYLALTHSFEEACGSLEASYRLYDDSYGITAHTAGLAWYQKLGDKFILRPALRYYTQSEADFYGVRFAGAPEFYSADYRLSSMDTWGYGLKLIWLANSAWQADLSVDRYVMSGNDGVTPDDAYPEATLVIFGVRRWL